MAFRQFSSVGADFSTCSLSTFLTVSDAQGRKIITLFVLIPRRWWFDVRTPGVFSAEEQQGLLAELRTGTPGVLGGDGMVMVSSRHESLQLLLFPLRNTLVVINQIYCFSLPQCGGFPLQASISNFPLVLHHIQPRVNTSVLSEPAGGQGQSPSHCDGLIP